MASVSIELAIVFFFFLINLAELKKDIEDLHCVGVVLSVVGDGPNYCAG